MEGLMVNVRRIKIVLVVAALAAGAYWIEAPEARFGDATPRAQVPQMPSLPVARLHSATSVPAREEAAVTISEGILRFRHDGADVRCFRGTPVTTVRKEGGRVEMRHADGVLEILEPKGA